MDIPKIITQEAYEDFRGFLSVPFDATTSAELDFQIHQINQGYSKSKFTLRGLHFQAQPHTQAKLVYCLHGSIYNVAVDIRPDSSAFGIYYAEFLSFENRKMMYIPKGFAHGYLTLEDDTLMQWCVDEDFCPGAAHCLRFDDADIVNETGEEGIAWPCNLAATVISEKDKNGMTLPRMMDKPLTPPVVKLLGILKK